MSGRGSDFCSELKDHTSEIHDESDKLINMKLAVALTDTKVWCQAIVDFYFVFRQLELSLEQLKDDSRLGILYFCAQPEYRRTELFEQDLEFYLGNNWVKEIKPSYPAEKYCKRIDEITRAKPVLLIAYIHSMYLALLAGGSMLKRIIKKTLGLSGNNGLALFTFGGDSSNRTELRNRIKDAINSLILTQEEKNEIMKEKFVCFSMNNSIAKNLPVSLMNYKRLVIMLSCAALGVAISIAALVNCMQ